MSDPSATTGGVASKPRAATNHDVGPDMTPYKSHDLPKFPPLPIDPSGAFSADLCGTWSYAQPVVDSFAQAPLSHGAAFEVPGEIVMQGLPFDPAATFVLERIVNIPHAWTGRIIRIRFESVYSACRIWISGRPAGHHLGANTPVDIDITPLVSAGTEVRITLHIENNSIADTLANGSKYAAHPLAGIPRKVTLYALPQAHLQALDVVTKFPDGTYDAAQLQVELVVSAPGPVVFELTAPNGDVVPLGTNELAAGGQHLTFTVEEPALWHTESPQLYTLGVRFGDATYSVRFGFRDIAVRNGRLYLNGTPIILRGVNHHETHPVTGRADTAKWGHIDVGLFRSAHVNLLRTSHYPPTKELVEACDALGMLLEIEAPVCFAFGQFGHMPEWENLSAQEQQAMSDYVVKASLEMVAFYRSHPSVVIWSIGNESKWAPPFARSAANIRAADPTRPLTFNWYKNGPECRDHVQIANHHYPDAGEIARFAADTRPVMFDEFAHLYCYNGYELVTDPGLRLRWGKLFAMQWEELLLLPNGLGGSIWAGIDDYFSVPQTDGTRRWVGYGQWGPLDGWRRKKPEYEAMKRVFDPIHLPSFSLNSVDGRFCLAVLNRFDFTDLSEVECTWSADGRRGQIGLAAAPGESTTIQFAPDLDHPEIELRFRLPRLNYDKTLTVRAARPVAIHAAPTLVAPRREGATVHLGKWSLSESAFGPRVLTPGGDYLPFSLAIIPTHPSWAPSEAPLVAPGTLGNVVGDWKRGSLRVEEDAIEIAGGYEKAHGVFRLTLDEQGVLAINYDFTLHEDIAPLQTGLSLSLPLGWNTLDWQLADNDQAFPDDHLARAAGRASLNIDFSPETHLPAAPHWPWSSDTNHLGSNDFRSTKLGIKRVDLANSAGRGISVLSDGGQSTRAQLGQDCTRLFVLDYSGQGSERFLESYTTPLVLDKGARLAGTVRLTYAGGKS